MTVRELVAITDELEVVSIVLDNKEVARGRAGSIRTIFGYLDNYNVEYITFGFPTEEDNAVWNTMIIKCYEEAEVRQ